MLVFSFRALFQGQSQEATLQEVATEFLDAQLEIYCLSACAKYGRKVQLHQLAHSTLPSVTNPLSDIVTRVEHSKVTVSFSPAMTWFEESSEFSAEVRTPPVYGIVCSCYSKAGYTSK